MADAGLHAAVATLPCVSLWGSHMGSWLQVPGDAQVMLLTGPHKLHAPVYSVGCRDQYTRSANMSPIQRESYRRHNPDFHDQLLRAHLSS